MPERSLYNEKELLLLVALGDEKAFEQLYHHYYGQLYPFLSRLADSPTDVGELMQQTFIRIWLSRDRLPEIENFRAWVFKVSSREHLTYLRSRLHHREKIKRAGTVPVKEVLTPWHAFQISEIKQLVSDAVQQMPPQRRKIYQLSRDKGYKADEIASLLNLSVSTVNNVLSAALKEIRKYLSRMGYTFLSLVCLLLRNYL